MPKTVIAFGLLLTLLSCPQTQDDMTGRAPQPPQLQKQRIVKDEFLLHLKEGQEDRLNEVLKDHDLELISSILDLFYHVKAKGAVEDKRG